MKKTFSLATIWVLIAGLCGLCSCTAVREEAPQEGLFAEELLCYVTTEDGVVTKTVNNGSSTYWADSDQLTAINIEDGAESYVSGHLTYRGNNTFGGRLTYSGEINDWYMIYPHRDDNKTPQQTHISIPATQVQTGNSDMTHIAGDGFPLVGKELGVSRSEQLSVRMRNVLARLDYKVTNTTSGPIVVKSIEFTANTEIAGDFVGDITYDNINWEAEKGATKKVLLTVNNAEEIAAGDVEQFYAGVVPFTIPAGGSVKAKVIATDANNNEVVFYHLFERTSTTKINAGKTYNFNLSFDANHSTDPKPDDSTPDDPTPVDPEKEDQELSFAQSTVTWQLGNGYSIGNTYDVQPVSGARTTVTYTSSNTNVATISGTSITIVGAGSTTITANAPSNDIYNAATKSYTLVVSQSSTPSGEAAYVKVTSEPTSWDGTYLIVDESSSMAFAAFSGNASSYAVSVTISNGQIVANSNVNKYAFTVTDAGVNHENSNFSGQRAYNLRNSDGMYIFGSSSEVQILSTNQKSSSQSSSMNTYYSVFKYSNGGVQVASAVQSSGSYRYYLGYTSGSFNYSGGSSVASSDTDRRLQLYKLSNGGSATKQNQNLSFAQSSIQWTLGSGYTAGNSYAVQAVSGAQTTVTYTSSNTNVATISGTNVVIVGAGTTTITANAAENDNYYAASKSYTLIISDGTTPTPSGDAVYVKVTSEPTSWDGTYLFVDESSSKAFAAFSANASSYAVDVTIVNGQIASNATVDKYALTVSDAGVEHANLSGQEAYNVKNSDGMFVFYSNSELQINSTNSRTSSYSSSATNYYHALKYSNGGVQVASSGHSSGYNKYYLGYVSGAFEYSSSSASDRRVQLYKLQNGGGSTPVNPSKQNQTLSFASPSVTWSLDNGYSIGNSYSVQSVSGAQTSVTYTSSNTNVVTVSGSQLRIVGAGTTIITANAAENDTYNAASQSYTLTITSSGSTPSSNQRTYTYQTSVSAGTYLLGGYESSGSSQYSIALFPTVLTGNWDSSQGTVTNGQYIGQRNVDSSNTLTFTNDTEIFNAEVELIASGSNWKIKVKSTGEYLSVPTTDNRIVYTSSESNATAFTISGGGSGSSWGGSSTGNGMGVSSGSYYFYHSGSAQGFSMRAYQVTNIRLYKLTSEGGSSSGKQDQNLSFNQSTVTISLNNYPVNSTYAVQSVNGAQTSVTYTSSNTNVATVSGTTLTIKGAGSTTITANATSSNTYNAASRSYTLVVTEASSGSDTGENVYEYVAPGSLVEGTYLIAGSESSELSVALFPNVTTGSWNSSVTGSVSNGEYIPHKVVGTNNSATSLTITDPEVIASEVELTKSGSNWRIQVKSTGKYLASPSQEYRITFGEASSAASFSISSGTSGATVQTGSYYFYHSGSAGGFTLRTNSTGNTRFYHKVSGSGAASGKQYQTLSFANSTVTLTLENASGTYQVQQVSGNQTSVTYTSSNSNVATVSGNTITIKGFGSTEITANAPANDTYYAASKSYTLYVNRASQAGVYNLENDCVYNYLNEATTTYTADNHSSTTLISGGSSSWGGWGGGGSSSSSGVYSYNGVNYNPSSSNRWDCPKPVTITWSSALSGSKDVYVYTDAAHTQQVNYIDQPITVSSSSNSVEVFNLIPEQAGNRLTYYYVVRSGSSEVASGNFTTEGRRRMVKISSTYSENNANNCRDFGGQITTSGKRIKFGRMYRGSNMDNTTSAEQKIIKQYMNIGLDVDLRGSSERNNPLGFTQITTYDANTYRGHTQESYSGTSDLNNAQNMGATLKRVMNAVVNGVNVYIHCRVGADRTGYTCMMLEAILGVPLERCDMDYEMTSFSVVGVRKRTSDGVNYYHSGVSQINNQSGSTYQEKAINYAVNTLGISRDLITQFQNTMLE